MLIPRENIYVKDKQHVLYCTVYSVEGILYCTVVNKGIICFLDYAQNLGNTVPVYIHYTGKCFGPFWMRKMILPLLGCLRSILLIITFDKLPGPDTRIKLWLRRAAAAERGSNS